MQSLQQTTPPNVLNYLIHMEKIGRRPQTIGGHSSILRFLARKTDLSPERVLTFLARHPSSAGRKENIANVYDSYAKYYSIPFSKPGYTREESLPFIPTEAEVEAVISACREHCHATTLRLMKETGMRIGEVIRLQFRDFDFVRKTVRVKPEKGSRARELRISERLSASLQLLFSQSASPWPTAHAARAYLERIRKVLAKSQNNPRFLNLHLHTLRHYFACRLYWQTKDLLYVKDQLGHRSIDNTMIYTRLVDFQEESGYVCKTASSVEEASSLIELGFDYITELDRVKLFRKRV